MLFQSISLQIKLTNLKERKMSLKKTGHTILLIGVLFLFSCAQGENDNETQNEVLIEASIVKEDIYLEDFIEKKSLVIEKLFNAIAFKTIDWIERDRVEYSPDKKRPELIGIPLNNYENILVNVNTKGYARRFIEIRDSITSNVNNSNFNVKEELQDFLVSKFYKNNILNETSKNLNIDKSEYIKNLEKVDSSVTTLIDDAIDSYYEIKMETPYVEVGGKEITPNENSFLKFLKEYVWWLLGILLISLLLNLFQFLKPKKAKKRTKETFDTANNERQKEGYDNNSFQPKTTKLNDSEVKRTIEQDYEELQQSLTRLYHKDCLAEVSLKFKNLKIDTITEAESSSFYNKSELQEFIIKKISQDRLTLDYELRKYVAKNDAKQEIDNRITIQNFIPDINTNIVQEEDVANKLSQLKQITISELPNVIKMANLNTTINALERDIKVALQKMVQDNSIFYFAFADSSGTLQDAKKKKQIERDSAIKLSINTDDVNKATFRLLLEKDDMMQAGIMSYDSFLIPICELTSDNFNSTGTTIVQIGEDGTMELENGTWKVKNKLPIKVI